MPASRASTLRTFFRKIGSAAPATVGNRKPSRSSRSTSSHIMTGRRSSFAQLRRTSSNRRCLTFRVEAPGGERPGVHARRLDGLRHRPRLPAAFVLEAHVAKNCVLDRRLRPAFHRRRRPVNARARHPADFDPAGGVARLERDVKRRGHVLYRDVGDQHVVHAALGGVPRPRLKVDGGQHVLASDRRCDARRAPARRRGNRG